MRALLSRGGFTVLIENVDVDERRDVPRAELYKVQGRRPGPGALRAELYKVQGRPAP